MCEIYEQTYGKKSDIDIKYMPVGITQEILADYIQLMINDTVSLTVA